MKKLTLFILMAASTHSFAYEGTITSGKYFGCTDVSRYLNIAEMLEKKDIEQFKQYMKESMLNGDCNFFEKGIKAEVTDQGFPNKLIKIRPINDLNEYWTNAQAVKLK